MAENNHTWRKALDRAAELWMADDIQEAIGVLEKALIAYPRHPLLIIQKYYMERTLEHRNCAPRIEMPPHTPDDPAISVLLASYNRNTWIRESIESVLGQTFSDVELIIINDGGTSEIEEIALSYGDSRIHYIEAEHGGLSSALNVGLRKARGEFISFIDDDDVYYPEHLDRLITCLMGHPDVLIAHTEWMLAIQREIGGEYRIVDKKKAGRKLEDCTLDAEFLKQRNFITTIPALVRRQGFEKAGGFNEKLGYCVHWDMWIRISEHGEIMRIPGATCEYRQREDGSNMTSNRSHCREFFDNIILSMHKGLLLDGNSLANEKGKSMLRGLSYILETYPHFIDLLDIRAFLAEPKPYFYFEAMARDFVRVGDSKNARAAIKAAVRAAPFQPKLWLKVLTGVPQKPDKYKKMYMEKT